jgi:AcrR family transcriptional regulator
VSVTTAAPTRRRLSPEARREQLVAAAMPVVAEQGFTAFSLWRIANRAGVTRNLLYHSFPRGRPDVALAVADEAGRRLTHDWVTDDTVSLPERLAANFGWIYDHAIEPSDAWRIHRHGRAYSQPEPELARIGERYVDVVISSIALNHLGTPDPPPLVRMGLIGFLAFAETVLDQARSTGTPREQVMRVLAETLPATVQSAQSASGG